MSSILDDIDTIINEGDTHVVKIKLFETFYSEIIRDYESHKIPSTEWLIKRMINDRKCAFEHLTVGDLKNYFYLNELEIRQLCSDKNTIKEVQNCSYSFCIRVNNGQYYNGYFRVNLDNSLTLLKGGTIMIEMEDDLGYFEEDTYNVGKYLVDLRTTPPEIRDRVKKDIEKCSICFTEDFYKELKTYCFKKFGLL